MACTERCETKALECILACSNGDATCISTCLRQETECVAGKLSFTIGDSVQVRIQTRFGLRQVIFGDFVHLLRRKEL